MNIKNLIQELGINAKAASSKLININNDLKNTALKIHKIYYYPLFQN